LKDGKIDRPEAPRGPVIARPAHGSAIPKAGKRFGEKGGEAPQGA
jgi:cell division protease FtsH